MNPLDLSSRKLPLDVEIQADERKCNPDRLALVIGTLRSGMFELRELTSQSMGAVHGAAAKIQATYLAGGRHFVDIRQRKADMDVRAAPFPAGERPEKIDGPVERSGPNRKLTIVGGKPEAFWIGGNRALERFERWRLGAERCTGREGGGQGEEAPRNAPGPRSDPEFPAT